MVNPYIIPEIPQWIYILLTLFCAASLKIAHAQLIERERALTDRENELRATEKWLDKRYEKLERMEYEFYMKREKSNF